MVSIVVVIITLMKKIILIFCLSMSSAWSVTCLESASLLTVLKLKDMVTAYSQSYYDDIGDYEDKRPMVDNYYSYTKVCEKEEVLDTILLVKKEHFKICVLRSVADSLDKSPGYLETSRLTDLITESVDDEDCSPGEIRQMEDQLISASNQIARELKKEKSDISGVCNIARKAFYNNLNLKKKCK